jgi:alpha-mannosidase
MGQHLPSSEQHQQGAMESQKSPTYPETNLSAGPKWIKHLNQDRLNQFVGGHFSPVNVSALLFIHRKDDEKHVKLQVWSAPDRSKPSFAEAMKQKFKPAKKGDQFGPSCK